MDTIDKIYIINLEERNDRWLNCYHQLNIINIT